ncbi:MAG: glycosyltransferase family 2 protein [Armatimonadota bacterium]
MKLSIVIPVYNERATLCELLRRVQRVALPGIEKELVVVEDGSRDGTRELLEAIAAAQRAGARAYDPGEGGESVPVGNLKVCFQERNQGKGAALRRGFGEATGDIVLIQDADLEYDPSQYPALLEPILSGVADVVYGSRFLGGPHRVLYYWHSVGNRFLTTLSNMLTNLNLTDMETCYKVFRREVLERIQVRQSRFGFEPEITAKVSKLRCRIYEVPISYYGRTYAEGKKIGWRDGLNALWCVLRYSLFP